MSISILRIYLFNMRINIIIIFCTIISQFSLGQKIIPPRESSIDILYNKKVKQKRFNGINYELVTGRNKINNTLFKGLSINNQFINITDSYFFYEVIKREGVKLSYNNYLLNNEIELYKCKTVITDTLLSSIQFSNFTTNSWFSLFRNEFNHDVIFYDITFNSYKDTLIKSNFPIYSSLKIAHNLFNKMFFLGEVESNGIFIADNTFNGYFSINYTNLQSLRIDDNEFKDKRLEITDCKFEKEVFISNKNLNELRLLGNTFKGRILIGDYNHFSNIVLDSTGNKKVLIFSNCYIDASLSVNFVYTNEVDIFFKNCTFGKSFSLNHKTSNLHFENCNFESNIKLSFTIGTDSQFLILKGVDVNKIDFDYVENISLKFHELSNYYEKEQIYQDLLDKFKNEHKNQSYRRLLWEYNEMKIKESPDYVEKVFTKISRWWWWYGLSRFNGINKSLLVFFGCYIFNFIFKRQMLNAYEIQHLEYYVCKMEHSILKKLCGYLLKNGVLTFFFTIFVMFSIRVDSSKLHFKQLLFTLAYFIQYILGIGILLFVVNYLLTS